MNFTHDMVQPLREKMQLSREDFAREVNVSYRTVYGWEKTEQPRKINRSNRINLIKLYKKHMVS